jgi:hypothetical protein
MSPSTRGSLAIFWNGEEVDGFLVYGFWLGEQPSPPSIPTGVWEDAAFKSYKLFGDGWTVWMWDVRLWRWPEPAVWRQQLQATLAAMIDAGACVSWCGVEGGFCDPPFLLGPDMNGLVWCALTAKGTLYGPPPLDGPFTSLTAAELQQVREAAGL